MCVLTKNYRWIARRVHLSTVETRKTVIQSISKMESIVYSEGDFVFAKLRGYRSWPARILQSDGRKYNVFFYGTCNTAILSGKHLYNYEKCKLQWGDPKTLRKNSFQRALLHAEVAVAQPSEDYVYYETLADLETNYIDALKEDDLDTLKSSENDAAT